MAYSGEASAAAAQIQDLQSELEQQRALVQQLEEDLLAAQQGPSANGASSTENGQTDSLPLDDLHENGESNAVGTYHVPVWIVPALIRACI